MFVCLGSVVVTFSNICCLIQTNFTIHKSPACVTKKCLEEPGRVDVLNLPLDVGLDGHDLPDNALSLADGNLALGNVVGDPQGVPRQTDQT